MKVPLTTRSTKLGRIRCVAILRKHVYGVGRTTLSLEGIQRNACSVGWGLCPARQHGSAITCSAKTSFVYIFQTLNFYCSSGVCVYGAGVCTFGY